MQGSYFLGAYIEPIAALRVSIDFIRRAFAFEFILLHFSQRTLNCCNSNEQDEKLLHFQ